MGKDFFFSLIKILQKLSTIVKNLYYITLFEILSFYHLSHPFTLYFPTFLLTSDFHSPFLLFFVFIANAKKKNKDKKKNNK